MSGDRTPLEDAAFWEGYALCATRGWNLAEYYRLRPPAGFDNKSGDWITGYLAGLEHAYIVENG